VESTQNIQEPDKTGREQPAPSALPPWDMYTVAVGLFSGYILIPMLVSNILTLTAPFLEPAYEIFIQQATTFASWVVIFFILAWRYRSNVLPWLGVDLSRSPGYYLKEAIHVILAMLTLMVLMSLWMKWTGGASERPYESYTSKELRIISFFAILMAPVLEEVVFRGFVQTTFHKISTPVRSVIFTCLLFLLFHGTYYAKIQALVYVLVLGLVLGYWRERTQSIIPGVVGHLFNNALASWVLFK
jgi:membrane protease YdiL (CAAX protease family)